MEEYKETENSLRENILRKIASREVDMIPSRNFTLRLASLVFLTIAVFLVSAFLWNLTLFSIRISSNQTLLGFGSKGWILFVQLFPWKLLFVDVVLIALLENLLRQFRFGYRRSILYLLLATLAVLTSLGFALDQGTPLNDLLLARADLNELPKPVGYMYQRTRARPIRESGICRCVILEIAHGKIVVMDPRIGTSTITVLVPQDSDLATTSSLAIGDTIFIAGIENEGEIQAFGISKIVR